MVGVCGGGGGKREERRGEGRGGSVCGCPRTRHDVKSVKSSGTSTGEWILIH